MKKTLLFALFTVSIVGCAHQHFQVTAISFDKDGKKSITTTRGGATTLFDSQANIAQFNAGQNTNGQTAAVGSLNQSASGSNAVALVQGAVSAAVSAAVNSAK